MEETFPFRLAVTDVVFSVVSLLLYLTDIGLDIWAVWCLYEEQNYFIMGLLISLLLTSSVLLQTFSWIWYSDTDKKLESTIEKFVDEHSLMAPVHIFQLGVFLRFVGLLVTTTCRVKNDRRQEGFAVYFNHDLGMLTLFEAFSESAPQLVLMTALILETREMHLFTVVKIIGSLSSLSFTVMSYHRKMRAFIPEKQKMGWSSSVMYFLWNLFLIGPRVVCVSLFASVLPCLIPAHFLFLWTILVLWAWWQKTDLMETKAGEWLYRATVGLILYISWFNVASGNTKLRGIIYHVVMGADTMLLLGLWCWRRTVESARLGPFPINPFLLIGLLMSMYITGVLLKLVYYWKFHPKRPDIKIQPLMKQQTTIRVEAQAEAVDTVDGALPMMLEPAAPHELELDISIAPQTGANKRMKRMAMNFYY